MDTARRRAMVMFFGAVSEACTALVSKMMAQAEAGDIQMEVPVKPVWPYDP